MFYKIDFLEKFAKFTGKHLCLSLFLTKLQTWGTAALLKRESSSSVFLLILRYFCRTPPVATSDQTWSWLLFRRIGDRDTRSRSWSEWTRKRVSFSRYLIFQEKLRIAIQRMSFFMKDCCGKCEFLHVYYTNY